MTPDGAAEQRADFAAQLRMLRAPEGARQMPPPPPSWIWFEQSARDHPVAASPFAAATVQCRRQRAPPAEASTSDRRAVQHRA